MFSTCYTNMRQVEGFNKSCKYIPHYNKCHNMLMNAELDT